MSKDAHRKIREPIVEGIFYPDSEEELLYCIESLSAASAEPRGRAFGICAPHAAYEKVGGLMASSFLAAADRKVERVVILGPVHRDFIDRIILPESAIFRTPLGESRVDQEAVKALLSCGTIFDRNDIPHLEEQCIEVLLPFSRYHFPEAKIVPVLLGRDSRAAVTALEKALFVAFGGDFSGTLLVVSANFSGGGDIAAGKAEADRIIEHALRGDSDALVAAKVSREISACGVGCLAALLGLRPSGKVRLLGRAATVSDLEKMRGVEYAALAVDD